jgi:putative nucleotidyltransferase with HDIG domain
VPGATPLGSAPFPPDGSTPVVKGVRPDDLLTDGRNHERAGRGDEALASYAAAAAASGVGDAGVRAIALRRQAALLRRRLQFDRAIDLAYESLTTAASVGDVVAVAEGYNALAGIHIDRGDLEKARAALDRALRTGMADDDVRARIEQNFGIIANIEGDLGEAVTRYQASLAAFRRTNDQRGCAIAYHNLGAASADHKRWADADRFFSSSLDIAGAIGDLHLQALALLNRTEVHLARQRYEDARSSAEEALALFDRLGERQGKAAAYRFFGVVYRETGAFGLAEARLKTAIDLAAECGATLEEAEACRDLAVLWLRFSRNHDAVVLLNRARRLFQRLGRRRDLGDVTSRVASLEQLFLEVVADWGRSLESSDTYTYGHSGRVAQYAEAVARALGLDQFGLMTVRVGAYLHDIGKIRVPHEILNKPGRLTAEEMAIMQMHPLWGLELVAGIEFPWGVKPIIRSHHEKVDGSGYPDQLRGEEVPLHAQIVCVADVFDAMTSARSYQSPMAPAEAVARMGHFMRSGVQYWRPDVFQAFLESQQALAQGARAAA